MSNPEFPLLLKPGIVSDAPREPRWRRHLATIRGGPAAQILLEYRRRYGGCRYITVSAAASAQHSHFEPAESYLHRRAAGSPWQELHDGLPQPAGRRIAVLAAHPNEPGIFFRGLGERRASFRQRRRELAPVGGALAGGLPRQRGLRTHAHRIRESLTSIRLVDSRFGLLIGLVFLPIFWTRD